MPNVLRISVENPDELLNTGMYGAGSLIRVQWSATQAGAFADVSGTGSTPTIPLVTLITVYTGFDPAGASTTWYRTRYENAGATRLSDWSAAFQTGPVTIANLYDLKQRLGYSPSETTYDEELLQYLSDSTDWIHSYTERYFLPDPASGTVTYLFDGYDAQSGGTILPIRRGIRSVTLLQAASATGGTLVTIPSTDYFLRPSVQDLPPGRPAKYIVVNDLSSSASRFWPGRDNIAVTGAFAFAAPPADVSAVCLSMTIKAWAARQAGQADRAEHFSAGTGDSGPSLYMGSYLTRKDIATLDRYRPVLVA